MGKKVIYNGGKDTFYYSSKRSILVIGKEYEVIEEKVSRNRTNYVLKDVKGEYNSQWFNEKVES